MTPLSVSVIVVSRKRPDALIRCLTGISQLRSAPFEVVVVADAAGLSELRRWPYAAHVKTVPFDEPNISIARNQGIEAASGEVVAFIDDDAVPEPGWLRHLTAVFGDSSVAAAGGFVRGRNGISWQRRAQSVDTYGVSHPLDMTGRDPVILTSRPGFGLKTEGTNMAFRRSVIAGIGGFDPNFRYFLDETDVNLRLAAQGASTALVPKAVVHHGYAPNATRRLDRVPRDLTQIGASWAVFLKRHCPETEQAARWKAVMKAERTRAIRYMVQGLLEPRDIRRLMTGLVAGYAEGLARKDTTFAPLATAQAPFVPFPSATDRPMSIFKGRTWSRHRLRAQAAEAARAGHISSVYLFSPTGLYHKRVFRNEGFWEQRGGLFGRSLRTDPIFRLWRFSKRVQREIDLWAEYQ